MSVNNIVLHSKQHDMNLLHKINDCNFKFSFANAIKFDRNNVMSLRLL